LALLFGPIVEAFLVLLPARPATNAVSVGRSGLLHRAVHGRPTERYRSDSL